MEKAIMPGYRELIDLQLIVSDIATQLNQRQRQSLDALQDWILKGEALFQKRQMPEAGKLAALRAKLQTGQPVPAVPGRKAAYFHAVNVLEESQEAVWKVMDHWKYKIDTASPLITQLLQFVYASRAFAGYDSNDFTTLLESIWDFCYRHEQLKGLTIQVLVQVSKQDALFIMAEEIDLEALKE